MFSFGYYVSIFIGNCLLNEKNGFHFIVHTSLSFVIAFIRFYFHFVCVLFWCVCSLCNVYAFILAHFCVNVFFSLLLITLLILFIWNRSPTCVCLTSFFFLFSLTENVYHIHFYVQHDSHEMTRHYVDYCFIFCLCIKTIKIKLIFIYLFVPVQCSTTMSK